jgi:CRISPR-associated endonuclease/helicase Cas3
MENSRFASTFAALVGYEPFHWHVRLYQRLLDGNIPGACDIPTGLGKTSVIPIWLIALGTASSRLPRRLVYIVNRRTVVDQATDIAEQLCERIKSSAGEQQDLGRIRHRLETLAGFEADDLIAISTLRGELADNEEWKKDPARPAIIIGTIDMIGSKLLCSGYGDRRYGRAHHAGLVGHDTLIVHDEAHLTPAFSELLRVVENEQQKLEQEKSLAIRVMELSATGRNGNQDAVTLEAEDEVGESIPAKTLRERLDAEKRLVLHPTDANRIREKIIELAKQHESKRAKVLIYVRSPEQAQKLEGELKRKCGNRVALLTGTLRGFERDALVETNPVYRALLTPHAPVDATVYLVSTSAGEVGIDLNADHMVCDLTALDSMIQRLGRVNRRGGDQRSARVDVVVSAELEEKEGTATKAEIVATRAALQRLLRNEDGSFSASPREVTKLLKEILNDTERKSAFQPSPPAIPATDILFDSWSLTSIHEKLPGRPEVAAFLHGITNDPPETYVAWRAEVPLLHQAGVTDAAVRDWFRASRLKSHELLRDNTDRVFKQLEKIRDDPERPTHLPIILLNERGEAERRTLDELTKDNASSLLAFRTVVLPVEAGGLTGSGFLDASEKQKTDHLDVAEKRRASQQPERKRMRLHFQIVNGAFRARRLDAPDFSNAETAPRECESARDAAAELAKDHELEIARLLSLRDPLDGTEEETGEYLLLLIEPAATEIEDAEAASYKEPPTISEHTRDVVERVKIIAAALSLDESLKRALIAAGELHDLGKNRDVWQHAIYNFPVQDEPLAKSGTRGMDWRRLGGYRHEFGSLLDATDHSEMRKLSETERELVLHLVATHHGHGRPHFEPETYNFEKHNSQQNDDAAREALRRFGRLQLRYGRWKLAWLESLLRCADAAASAEPSHSRTKTTARLQ